MVRLVEAMPEPVRRTLLVPGQYGFALNRAGRSKSAERELLAVLADHGPSSETLGLRDTFRRLDLECAVLRCRRKGDPPAGLVRIGRAPAGAERCRLRP